MSMEALTWARKQRIGNSRAKAVFMAYADFANEDFTAFPSIASVMEYTELDRKTIIKQIDMLRESGYLADTGERRGETRQIPVYQLQSPTAGAVSIGPAPTSEQSQKRNHSKHGTVKQYQKRNGSENGTVPSLTDNSPKFSGKQSQVSAETVPSLGHGTPKEPSENPQGSPRGAPATCGKPEKPFDRFWSAWPSSPRKVGKIDCEKRWKREALDTVAEQIIGHVEAMKATQQWKDGFEPAPATYLNQKRWNDEVPRDQPRKADGSMQAGASWWEDARGIEDKGLELEVRQKPQEPFWRFKVRVFKRAGDGPWREELLADMLRTKNQAYADVHQYFYDHPPVEAAT